LNNLLISRKNSIKKAQKLLKEWILTKDYLLENNFILYLELFPLSEEVKLIWNALVSEYLNNKKIVRSQKEWWNIIISKKFIEKNKEKILSNLNAFCQLFVEIESDNWNPKKWNKNWSSASWLYQFLTNDWKSSIEYFDKKTKTWKRKSNHKKNEQEWKKREVRNTSSYETALNKIPGFIKTLKKSKTDYSKEINILSNLFKKATWYNEIKLIRKKLPSNLSVYDLGSLEQTMLFFVNSFKSTKIIHSNGIKIYMWLVILWNTWWTKELYKIFHHSKPDKQTLQLIDRSLPLHRKKFIQI